MVPVEDRFHADGHLINLNVAMLVMGCGGGDWTEVKMIRTWVGGGLEDIQPSATSLPRISPCSTIPSLCLGVMNSYSAVQVAILPEIRWVQGCLAKLQRRLNSAAPGTPWFTYLKARENL